MRAGAGRSRRFQRKISAQTAVVETILTDAHGAQVRMRNGRVMRYLENDDFGASETALLACNFWYMDALCLIGGKDEARQMLETILNRSSFGLLSEDIHPETGECWGNFPRAYSMARTINTATRLSSSKEEAWASV